MKLLIVDDEQLIARALARLLAGDGHEARFLSCAEEVTDTDLAWADVVITDWDMPGAGGLGVMTACGAYRVPCIVHTGNHDVAMAVGLAGGVVVTKPTSLTDLREAIAPFAPTEPKRSGPEAA